MAILWPSTLPKDPLLTGYSETVPDGRLRTGMSKGPSKVRANSSALPRTFTARIYLTVAQLATFETFANTTLKSGSLRFEWTHPRLSTAIECRIVGGDSLYTLAPVSGDGKWEVQMTLEVMP